MREAAQDSNELTDVSRLVFALSLAAFLLHVLTSAGYGFFRDEFYYIACSERLAAGYVDHPPLSIYLLSFQRSILGDSLFGIRFLPAVASAITVLMTGLMARELGGRRFAQGLAALAALMVPIYLGTGHFFSMNAFDLMFWSIAAFLVIRICHKPRIMLWFLLGMIIGLGLENKISILWLGAGLTVGVLATSSRRWLLTPGPWFALVVAAVLFAPHVLWQIENGWPTLEFMRNATGQKMVITPPFEFLITQLRVMNPATFPVWIAGLIFFFLVPAGKPYRLLGWAWVSIFVYLAFSGSTRPGYLAPAYTWLFAAGGVALEMAGERLGGWRDGAIKTVSSSLILALGILMIPLAIPVLPVDLYVSYSKRLGVAPSTSERKELGRLPQFYADMHGWEEIVETIAGVYRSLPAEDRSRVAIFTPNYGIAGAIDLLGQEYDLPEAISGHNNYWLWGPRGHSGELVLYVGGTEEDLLQSFEEVTLGATVQCVDCMPHENNRPIWICRNLRRTFIQAWPNAKHYD